MPTPSLREKKVKVLLMLFPLLAHLLPLNIGETVVLMDSLNSVLASAVSDTSDLPLKAFCPEAQALKTRKFLITSENV